MKTSNKLLLTAVLIFVGTLIVYNVALTAAYHKGDFRDPYKDFTSLENKNFSAVIVNGASKITVEIIQGDYQVRMHENSANYVKVNQQGNELVLDVDFPGEYNVTPSGKHIVISCPDLKTLKTDAVFTIAGKEQVDRVVPEKTYLQHKVVLTGMVLDSLTILQDNASAVLLEGNKIGSLNATTGLSAGSSPKLHLTKGNVISKTNLTIQQNSQLVLDDVALPNITYIFSDNARTTISGASLSILKR